MSKLSLYRKYRPKILKEVIGQDHIIGVLEGAVKLGNVSHAYLFSGPRGTGKTSVARIFSRMVGASPNDTYEIDAASYTGVDDVREINEGVQVLPLDSPYKIYIVDEAHMLSKPAFNALLKTLEEPPKHVIFILATTEFGKIPETVVSRCQIFNFKKPSLLSLREMVLRVAKAEGFTLEPASADLVALLGDGSFRDAHGILEKVISASKDQRISVKEVERVTGAPSSDLVNNFIKSISESDLEKGIGALTRADNQNIEMKVYLKMILQRVRAILLLRLVPKIAEDFAGHYSSQEWEFLRDLSAKDRKINASVLTELLRAYDDIGYSAVPSIALELALIRIIGDSKLS